MFWDVLVFNFLEKWISAAERSHRDWWRNWLLSWECKTMPSSHCVEGSILHLSYWSVPHKMWGSRWIPCFSLCRMLWSSMRERGVDKGVRIYGMEHDTQERMDAQQNWIDRSLFFDGYFQLAERYNCYIWSMVSCLVGHSGTFKAGNGTIDRHLMGDSYPWGHIRLKNKYSTWNLRQGRE